MQSDDFTDMGTPKPRRANPMQPDRPAGADDTKEETPTEGSSEHSDKGSESLDEQERSAIENVREGYGKP